jgi:hypothetical protein
LLLVVVLAFGAASPAWAQGRDASDRSLRSDHDAMRNDIRQDRLRKPAAPLLPPWQEQPVVQEKPKPKRSGQR